MSDELHRNRTLWLAAALHAFTHLYQVALIPLYLLIQKDFQLASEGQSTFLVTALSIAYFLPSYPMGILADRLSRKKLLGIGLIINAVGFIGLSFAPNYPIAVACAMLAGLGGSFYHPPATALIARLFPNETGKALGKVGIGASVGFFIGPIYSGWRANASNWRQPVLEMGIAGLIAAALFLWLAKEHSIVKNVNASSDEQPPEKLFPSLQLWLIFLAMSFLFCLRDFAGASMASLGSLFLQHARGLNVQETGFLVSCIFLASVVSNPLFGHLSDRGRTRWTSFVLAAAAVTIFIFPRMPPGWSAITLAAYGFFFMASYPIVEAALMESVHDSIRGRVFGLFITIGGFLGNLSHWIIGDWVKRLGPAALSPPGYFPIYNTLAAFVLISLFGLICLRALRKKENVAGISAPAPASALRTPHPE